MKFDWGRKCMESESVVLVLPTPNSKSAGARDGILLSNVVDYTGYDRLQVHIQQATILCITDYNFVYNG